MKGLDPYFEVLEAERPYLQVQLSGWKDFGERFTVEAGFSLRELRDEDEEGAFNHEFWRAHVSPTVRWPDSG